MAIGRGRVGAVYLKSGNLNLRAAEFGKLMEAIVQDIALEAQREFEHQILSKGVKLTGDLRDSFNNYNIKMVQQMAGYVEYNFKQYGRFKDLRYVEYRSLWVSPENIGKKYDTKNPYPDDALPESVAGMMRYIEEVGLSNFKYIPGYGGKASPISQTVAIKRLAWTLSASRMKLSKVKNKRNNDWYTKGMMAIKKQVWPEVQMAVADWILNGTYTEIWEG